MMDQTDIGHKQEAERVIFGLIHSCLQWKQDLGHCLGALEVPALVTPAASDLKAQRILTCNAAYTNAFKYAATDLSGRPIEALRASDDSAQAEAELNEALRQEGHGRTTLVVMAKDGSRLRIERIGVRAPSWPDLDLTSDVYIFFDRVLGEVPPIAGDSDASPSLRIALQLETLLRLYIRQNYREGMHPAQWSALRYFRLAPPDARTLTGFARAHHTTMGTASTTVSTLVGKGYLKKHGFRGAVEVTEAGRELLERDPLGHVVAALDAMTDAERHWAGHVLTALSDAFNTDGD